jgi:hypothetical protein
MFTAGLLERDMRTPAKKAAMTSSSNGDRKFPAEAYDFTDDVTPMAVEEMRQKAAKVMNSDEWEVIDGFALAVPA